MSPGVSGCASGGGVRCPLSFHARCGALVALSVDLRCAHRQSANQEFNHGVVFSASRLQEDTIFEVRLDEKINSWSGSIEMGVSGCDPATLATPFPSSATELRNGSWIMSGNSILKDGRSINENYGTDLDKLQEGDRVGVLKTAGGELIFFVNGISQGVAAKGLPETVYAVVDLYGKCSRVTLMDNTGQEARIASNALSNEATAAAAASSHSGIDLLGSNSTAKNAANTNIAAMSRSASSGGTSPSGPSNSGFNSSKLRFHERRGQLVKLSNNNRTAERRRPYDEFNNGVVMTHRPLRDNELFEIRIDRLVDKWSGSIEVGITTHNPSTLDFPATMTNQRSGTMMMSGCGILTNGRGTRREYGQFNLDELSEKDRIGMMRKSNGNLHFYINGLDQGVAATKVPQQMWGVVDLYGMTVKVTIVDRDERDEQNLITRRNMSQMMQQAGTSSRPDGSSGPGLALMTGYPLENNRLLFHPNCGSHAAVINGGITAHRPNASDDFNFGVVLTQRPLKTNEVFEVRLDRMVQKWAGSVEIGVTTHAPGELDFPSTMTNIRSGTWMMTGNGVMHNGTTVIDEYGVNLDKLKVGDRVAVVRKENGTIHFFVNSEDQGPAAKNVPECVYGVIDLYGQAAQATIMDLSDYRSPDGSEPTSNTMYSQIDQSGAPLSGPLYPGCLPVSTPSDMLRFHHLHGRNARIANHGVTAMRPNALGEFNDAIVISNRPLRDGELFEIVLERMVERWSGSIEAGVTLIRAEDLEFPNTMTDIDYDTWMLSGSAVMQDGQTVRNGYSCDLDALTVGSRLGMYRATDGSLHYTVNGEDQGVACESIPSGVFAVIDLYGQCAQVSICNGPGTQLNPAENSLASSQMMESSHLSLVLTGAEVAHRFHPGLCSKGIELRNERQSALRSPLCLSGMVFGSQPLEGCGSEEIFEIRIDEVDSKMAGSLRIGATSQAPCVDGFHHNSFSSFTGNGHSEDSKTIWLSDSEVILNGKVYRTNYTFSLDRLTNGDRLGVKRAQDGSLRFVINGEDFGIALAGVDTPKRLYPALELFGSTMSVTVISASHQANVASPLQQLQSQTMQDSLEVVPEKVEPVSSPPSETAPAASNAQTLKPLMLHENHGRNIQLKNGQQSAIRTDSYNQGVVVTQRALHPDEVFSVRVDSLNAKWTSSLMIGLLAQNPDKLHLPVTALGLKKHATVLCGDAIFQNGNKINSPYGPGLDALRLGTKVGVAVDLRGHMHLYINDVDQGIAAKNVVGPVYGMVDLYGQCEELTLVTEAVGGDQTAVDSIEQDAAVEAAGPSLQPDEVIGDGKSKDSVIISAVVEEEAVKHQPASMLGALCESVSVLRNCDYMNLCVRFRQTLGLPANYFTAEALPLCYCLGCTKVRGDAAYVKKGQPVRDFATPVGWCRFQLRVRPDLAALTETWHSAFHGTKPAVLRRLLDQGELLSQGDLGLARRSLAAKSKLKEDVSSAESPQLLFSPTLRYIATQDKLCPPVNFADRVTRRQYVARVALQVEVHPGSYKVGAPTVSATAASSGSGGAASGGGEPESPPDPHFKLDETEWLTKEKGNTAIVALLVSVASPAVEQPLPIEQSPAVAVATATAGNGL